MQNFYCGMHFVVNMAEHTAETLKLVEREYDQPSITSTESESGTLRLVRTACKAFEKRGNEKSGLSIAICNVPKETGNS